MSKRFGRNQRRHLKQLLSDASAKLAKADEVAELNRKAYSKMRVDLIGVKNQLAANAASLLAVQGCPWAPAANGAEAMLIPEENVLEFEDSTRWDQRNRVFERQASLLIPAFEMTEDLVDRLDQRYRHYRDVSWRGVAWKIHSMSVDRGNSMLGGGHNVEVKLIAMGRPS